MKPKKPKKGMVLCINPKNKNYKHVWIKEEIANNPELLKALGLEKAK